MGGGVLLAVDMATEHRQHFVIFRVGVLQKLSDSNTTKIQIYKMYLELAIIYARVPRVSCQHMMRFVRQRRNIIIITRLVKRVTHPTVGNF
jgi:hypothetical protein